MKRQILGGLIFAFFFAAMSFGTPVTQIRYEATDLGSDRWLYSYDVINISLTPAIEEFTIWFDYGLYDSLTVVRPDIPPGWNQIVIQPEPVLGDDGYYDALALTSGIDVGQTVSGFSVSFDWLVAGKPGSQFYEIIDPDNNYITVDSGMTIPEPGTFILFCLSGAAFCRRRRTEDR